MIAHWTQRATTMALKYVTHTTPLSAPTAFWLRLSSASADPAAVSWTELTVTNYAAASCALAYGGDYFAWNSSQIDFVNLGAGALLGIGIWDASTAGNLLWWGDLASVLTFATGHTITWPANIIKIGMQV